MVELLSEKELNIIRGKMICGAGTIEDCQNFMDYVLQLESLVEEASNECVYGTEGYRHRLVSMLVNIGMMNKKKKEIKIRFATNDAVKAVASEILWKHRKVFAKLAE